MRASTKIPIEQMIQNEPGNKQMPIKVVSLDSNCLAHSDAMSNEITMKAFKMACLQYRPSPVKFEQCDYTRKELIEAKNTLLKYCLTQLRHLDLGLIENKKPVETASSNMDDVGENLASAWRQLSTNQEKEGVNYGEMDPQNIPSWPMSA